MEMARLLREAAGLTKQPTLEAFLEKRAAAFISNDYYESDIAWMELDASIEPTIGPYEVYEDEWFNFKAAFEAFITLTDAEETKKLARFSGELQELENNLPIDPQFRRAKLGGLFADPRRERRAQRRGRAIMACKPRRSTCRTMSASSPRKARSARMLKNFQQAKFEKVLLPIAERRARAGGSRARSRSSRSSRTF